MIKIYIHFVNMLNKSFLEIYKMSDNGTINNYNITFSWCFSDAFCGICAGQEKFVIQGDSPQFLNWEKYGLKITVPQDTLSPTESNEITITALVGGCYDLPEGTELISALYIITVSLPLKQPVKLEIQHCGHLLTEDHASYLSFITTSINQPVQFHIEEGGQFYPGNQYGSIYLSQFSVKGIIKSMTHPFRRIVSHWQIGRHTETSDHESHEETISFSASNLPISTEIKIISSTEGKSLYWL